MSKARGLAAAVVAYTVWGLLAPIGKLLLESMGPFTINVLRTAGSLIVFVLIMGPGPFTRHLRLLGKDRRLWILGVAGLGGTFGAYLLSVKYLEPTIAALTIYLAPILISWGAKTRLGESASPLVFPTIALTLVGGFIAVIEPSRGGGLPRTEGWGLFLGLLGVLGWSFYTLYLKHLSAHYEDDALTVTSFASSGLAFLLAALVLEGLRFDATAESLGLLALYIVFPSVISFKLYALAVRHAGASIVSVLLGIELASTAVFSYFLTGEEFHFEKIIGLGLVLVAVTGFLLGEVQGSAPPTAQKDPDAQTQS